jgi:hypothetical protein
VIRTMIPRQRGHGRDAPSRCQRSVALLHQPYWLWLRCDACGHRVAVALVPFVIRWGADAESKRAARRDFAFSQFQPRASPSSCARCRM